MYRLSDFPAVLFVVSLAILWLSAYFGLLLHKWARPLAEDEREDFNVILTATLPLLGVIIGFSFSMAIQAIFSSNLNPRTAGHSDLAPLGSNEQERPLADAVASAD